jgi:lysophospholipase L1-like esterase
LYINLPAVTYTENWLNARDGTSAAAPKSITAPGGNQKFSAPNTTADWVLIVKKAAAAGLRILPLGDSITQAEVGHNSYRRPFWQRLQSAAVSADLVGSLRTNSGGAPPNPDFDLDHEGHWGWRADQILAALPGWLLSYEVDLCLLHLGTNDLYQGQSVASTIQDLEGIVAALRARNPKVVVLVAQILPVQSSTVNPKVLELNSAIREMAARLTNGSSAVVSVDQYSGFSVASDTYDGVHPNSSGEAKMADKWFTALQGALRRPPAAPGNLRILK